MPKKITCTMGGCTDPAEVVLTYPDQEEEPDVICHRHAEWIFNTIAAERTCATCEHWGGRSSHRHPDCEWSQCLCPALPAAPHRQDKQVRVDFGCNRWEPREGATP